MAIRIKNWEKFQHYQTGRGTPPWVKLYRDLLNDKEWFKLDGDCSKFLINCWLIAAENNGNLPDIETIAWRLRLDSKLIAKMLSACQHWIISDASTMLADCYQVATPDKRQIREETEQTTPDGFDTFYQAYPKKVGKPAALKAYRAAKVNGHLPELLADIENRLNSGSWKDIQFIPNPATYLNQRRWEDAQPSTTPAKDWI